MKENEQQKAAMDEFRSVLYQWSKENGRILKGDQVKLFGAGYFAGMRKIGDEVQRLKEMEKGDEG